MIEDLMFNTITTYRLTATTGIQKAYQVNLTNQGCLIQPVTPEFAQKTGMVFDRTYNCLVPIDTDIEITDRAIDQDGKTYSVTGSLNRNYGYSVQHTTYLLNEESKATPDV